MPSFTRHRPCTSPIQPHYPSNSSTYSISPSPSPSPPPTIHHRRTLSSRTNSSSRRSPPPPSLPGLGLPVSPFASLNTTTSNSNTNSNLNPEGQAMAPAFAPQEGESDAECWSRMLALQREYHCYNSARLEAAVEALEKGCKVEDVPMPSRFCLDLLNEELKAQIESTNLH
ncbi:hypothetical protein BKA61DRAFT_674214 [Leptodontidium sp. MPI-SDFR-AT-0119]|nr:hypothetical protein BKA61DRAFT_674214 [Leptodontidium sp. MPI-SDFR-AT-0119]